MKISISTYSFGPLMGSGRLTQFDCIRKAKEMGFDGIEFVDILPHDGSLPEEYAKELRLECEAQNLPIASYTFGSDFLNGSDGDLEAEIERVKKQLDLAEILGAPLVRHDATGGYPQSSGKYRGFDDALPRLADACRRVTEYAQSKGIRTTVENHGQFCQDSRRVEKLVTTVAHENFGLLCDIGNFACVDEDSIHAVSRIAPYALHAHAKDFHIKSGMESSPGSGFFRSRGGNYLRGAVIGHGNIPVKQCLAILKQVNYNGYVSIEFEGMEDTLTGISIGLENLRRYLSEI